ncbi:MAG: D-glycero-beta-D-manno-heptose 1-phosphate adenylyltransferase [Chloroflexi bacterium]|nr:D-glycero-beta-D-manno-heptose 1-phosphate adenylyltransferase [Chloroflexota bacterium]
MGLCRSRSPSFRLRRSAPALPSCGYTVHEVREKVLDLSRLLATLARSRAAGAQVVLTNGCFDLLHVGHVRYLQQARALGDLLVVGVNTDESVRRLKGPGRPITPQDERAEVLAALACVGYVVLFAEPTAEALVAALRPEVYVKGGDYQEADLPEAAVVHGYGGRVEILPFVEGRSTSQLVLTIARQVAVRPESCGPAKISLRGGAGMPEARTGAGRSFTVDEDQPLIGILIQEDDHESVQYFTDEQQADAALDRSGIQRTLSLAGAWKDMDWAEAADELDRIRHESRPTPPIELTDLAD